MKKLILVLSLFMLNVIAVFGQTTATDFTANDCNNNSHNLFTELNAGKTVVLVWVMPCTQCVNGAKGAYNVVKTFDASKVNYYLMDDAGDDNCSALAGWASTYNITVGGNVDILNNVGGQAIKESDYGGSGMPHVAVVGGGAMHKVYFNELNSAAENTAGIQTAISQAMAAASVGTEKLQTGLSAYPNPATDNIVVDYASTSKANVSIDIVNLIGKKVYSISRTVNAGQNTEKINVSSMPNGIYFIKLNVNGNIETIKLTVAK